MLQPQYFLHVANILFVLSYSVRDIMSLRVLALCGSLISLPYYYLQPEVLWQPIGWAAVFMAINGYHVWRLWLERRPVELSADEARLYDLTFFPLTRRRFVDLARLGRWADLEAGDVLARPGQPVEEVVVPLTDGVEARIGERVLGRFAAGEIVGAAAVYGRPQLFEVVARESCRVLRVPVAAIKRHAEQDDQLARTLERIAREDLARKLERLVGQAATLPPTPASASQPPPRAPRWAVRRTCSPLAPDLRHHCRRRSARSSALARLGLRPGLLSACSRSELSTLAKSAPSPRIRAYISMNIATVSLPPQTTRRSRIAWAVTAAWRLSRNSAADLAGSAGLVEELHDAPERPAGGVGRARLGQAGRRLRSSSSASFGPPDQAAGASARPGYRAHGTGGRRHRRGTPPGPPSGTRP